LKRTFNDANGREWEVNVNAASARRAREIAGIDLFKIAEDRFALMARLSEDLILLADTLYAVCKTQADALEITDEQFGEAMIGDAIEAGFDALMEGICDLLPGNDRREAMRKVYHAASQASQEIRQQGSAAITQALQSLTTAEIMNAAGYTQRAAAEAVSKAPVPGRMSRNPRAGPGGGVRHAQQNHRERCRRCRKAQRGGCGPFVSPEASPT
jgi:hypothetical protein